MHTLNKLAFFLAALALLVINPLARAATAAGAGIELDGKTVAGYTITHDSESREELVKNLSNHYLTFERDFKIPVAAKNPASATLKGKVRLYSKIRGERQFMAATTELHLVKRDGKWFVEPESLARAVKAEADNQKTKPDEEKTAPMFTVWDSGWKVQSTFRLSEKGVEKLQAVLSREPDETTKAAIALAASGALQFGGQRYAIEPEKLVLSDLNGAKI